MSEYKNPEAVQAETDARPEPVRVLNSIMALHIFYGDTCNPCHEAKPHLLKIERELKEKYPDNFISAWHNMKDPDSQFEGYNITSIPTIILKQIATTENDETVVNCIYRWTGMPTDVKRMQDFLETMCKAHELLPKINLFDK